MSPERLRDTPPEPLRGWEKNAPALQEKHAEEQQKYETFLKSSARPGIEEERSQRQGEEKEGRVIGARERIGEIEKYDRLAEEVKKAIREKNFTKVAALGEELIGMAELKTSDPNVDRWNRISRLEEQGGSVIIDWITEPTGKENTGCYEMLIEGGDLNEDVTIGYTTREAAKKAFNNFEKMARESGKTSMKELVDEFKESEGY
jgi:hypothetical protein